MRLFITYAHADKSQVESVVDLLREGGHEPWFEKLLPHQNWEADLLTAITGCDALIYVLSSDSVVTEWCQWAFAQAVKQGKPVIPILVGKAVSVPPALSDFRQVDFSEGANVVAVARLMGGLAHLENFKTPSDNIPAAPEHPRGIPAQAMGAGAPPGVRPPGRPGFEPTEE